MDGYFGTTLKTEVLCDTGPDPLPRSIHRPASEKSLKWPFAGGPMMALS